MIAASVPIPTGLTPAAPAANGTPIWIIPDVLSVTPDSTITSTSVSGSIIVTLLGNQVNTLSGNLNWSAGTTTVSDVFDIDVLGFDLVSGSFGLDVDHIGIKATGNLTWLGHPISLLNGYILSWP